MKKYFISGLLFLSILSLISCSPRQAGLTPEDGQSVARMLSYSDSGTNFLGAYALAEDLYRRNIRTPDVLFSLAFTKDKVKPDAAGSIRLYLKCVGMLERDPSASADPLLKIKAYFYLGYTYGKRKKTERADEYLNSAMAALDRLNTAGRLDDGIGFYLLAYCLERQKLHDLSVEYYQKAIDWFEQNRPGSYYLRGSYYNIGLHYYNVMDYKNAVIYWRLAYEKEPASGYFKETYKKWFDTARDALGFDE